MISADDSLLLRRSLHPAALAALRTEGRFRDLSQRVLSPERPALREARQVVADVLFGLSPARVRRFEARGVLHFDLDSPSALGDATREAWETVCSRLDLPWVDDPARRFFDRTVRSWHTRDGQRVRVHRQGTGGGVDVRTIAEEELLDADDPAALLAAVAAIDLAKFDVGRDLPALRAHLLAVEARHGVTDAHRSATTKIRTLGASLSHAHGQQGPITGFALSPDGRHLATGSWCGEDYDRGGVAQVWELASGRCVNTLDPIAGGVGWPDASGAVQWTDDGGRLGLAHNTNCIGAWDPFERSSKPQSHTSPTHGSDRPPAWCWSPDGGRVCVACWSDTEVPGFFVGLDAGPRHGRYQYRSDPKPAALGNKLAKGLKAQLHGAHLDVRAWLRWSSDGARVYGHAASMAYVTDAKGQATWAQRVSSPVAWSRDGLRVADASDGVTLRDGVTGARTHNLAGYVDVAALSFGVRGAVTRLAAIAATTKGGAAAVHVFDDGVHRVSLATTPAKTSSWPGDFAVWAWSPEGDRAALLTADGAIEVWSLADDARRDRSIAAPAGTRGIVWGDGGVLVALGPTCLRFVRADDGATLGDHVFLREAEGLRPLEDEKGDLGEDARPDPTFALGGERPSWVTAFSNGLVIAPKSLRASLDGALCWAVHQRFAWPYRWGEADVVGDAQAAAKCSPAPEGFPLKRLRAHAMVRAGWDPPDDRTFGDLSAAALGSLDGLDWRWAQHAASWVRALMRLHARRGEAARALAASERVGDYQQRIAGIAEVVTILTHAGRQADARDVAKVFEENAQWMKKDTLTTPDVMAALAAAHDALGHEEAAKEWFERAEKDVGYEPSWHNRLALARALVERGRDDDARRLWAAACWNDGAPSAYEAHPWLLHLLRSGRAGTARAFLMAWREGVGEVAEETRAALTSWLTELGLTRELDDFAELFSLKVTASDRARAVKRQGAKDRDPATSKDRAALVKAHAAGMELPRAQRRSAWERLALDAARRNHLGAVIELLEALSRKPGAPTWRVATAFRALWIAASGFDVIPY